MAASLWSLLTGSSSQELWDSAKFSLIKDISITQNEIGRGSFGVVYGAVYEGTQCVAKEIHSNLIGGGVSNNVVSQSFIKEINILSTLRHPNIVNFFGVHFREGSHVPVLIIERMWMSLAKLLEEKKSIPFVVKVHILHDVACGLKFLHGQKPPVIHRDLTANNILVNKNMDAKITDLGLATALEAISRQRMSIAPGNLVHMPPEALQSNPMYTTTLDIFSFGCVSLHTLTQQFPLPTNQFESSQMNKDTVLKVSEYRRRWKYVEMIKDQCTHFVYLISACLNDGPEYRPDAEKVCKWIEEYWKKPEIKQNCSQSVIDYFQQDKISLITSVDKQSTRANDMESTVQLYKAQFQELVDSAATKDERILFLQKQNNDLQSSMESQQAQQATHSVPANTDIMQKEIEELKLKLIHEAEVHTKSKEEMDQKAQKEVNNLKLELKSQKEMFRKEAAEKEEKFKKEVAYWKAKAEHKDPSAKAEANHKESSNNDINKLHKEMEELKLKSKYEEKMRIEMEKEAAWKASVRSLTEKKVEIKVKV